MRLEVGARKEGGTESIRVECQGIPGNPMSGSTIQHRHTA